MAKQRIAVVTGASSGLGREFVKLLLNSGRVDEVWALARDQEKLDRVRQACGEAVKTFSIDLSRLSAVKDFADVLRGSDPQIAYLINNAGYAKFCSCMDLDLDTSVNMIDLNISAVVSMGLICIPYMQRGAHILNISSQASFQPLPYQNLYSSTKAFVRNYSRALQVELKGRGISVTAVCPGWMDTALYDRATIGAEQATRRFVGMVSPERVAAKALRDAEKGRDMSVYSPYVKLCHAAAKILPQRLMMKLWLIQQRL